MTYSGDIDAAKRLRGEADSQLCILEEQMRKQGALFGKQPEQGSRTIKLPGGGVIDVGSCFSIHDINIHVPKVGDYWPDDEERDCPCWPCFTQGKVTAIHSFPDNLTDFSPESYSVEICVSSGHNDRYVEFERMCFASDCAQYSVGQPVIISAAPGDTYNMCHSRSMNVNWFIIFPLNPFEEPLPAKQWERNTDGGLAFPPQRTEGSRSGY